MEWMEARKLQYTPFQNVRPLHFCILQKNLRRPSNPILSRLRPPPRRLLYVRRRYPSPAGKGERSTQMSHGELRCQPSQAAIVSPSHEGLPRDRQTGRRIVATSYAFSYTDRLSWQSYSCDLSTDARYRCCGTASRRLCVHGRTRTRTRSPSSRWPTRRRLSDHPRTVFPFKRSRRQ